MSIVVATSAILVITAAATFILFPNISTVTTTETFYTSVSTTSYTESLTTPATALVFGLVSSTGQGTSIAEFIFKSVSTGAVYTIPIIDGHSFSVRLPNPDTLNVTAVWVGSYYWQTGEIPIGVVITNWGPQSTDAQSFNQVVETPNSVVNVTGIVSTQSNLIPLSVRFEATNGLAFELPTTANGTYVGQLANIMNYTALAKVQYPNGTIGYCNAGSLNLDEGPNVANTNAEPLSC